MTVVCKYDGKDLSDVIGNLGTTRQHLTTLSNHTAIILRHLAGKDTVEDEPESRKQVDPGSMIEGLHLVSCDIHNEVTNLRIIINTIGKAVGVTFDDQVID